MNRRAGCRSLVTVACVLLLVVTFFFAEARAEFPERPITMLCGFAPGGSSDVAVRTLASVLEKILGKPVVVETKGGGGGTLALALLANAKPDGYTLCGTPSTQIVRAPQFQKVTYKPLKSFTPLLAYASPFNAIAVKADAPWKTLKEMLAYAKKNPNKIKYGDAGIGTAMHHAMAFLEYKEGIKWIHVPYKGGADALTAMLGGHIDASSLGPEWVPMARSGMIRMLAIAETKRNPNFPDVPTLIDLGYEFANDTVFSVVGPAGLPPDVEKKLQSGLAKAVQSEEMLAVLKRLDMAPILIMGKEYGELLKTVWFKLEKELRDTGIIKESATSPY
jgi:tripartite-type tricarboxylate transporter receptor subunit TctC